MNLLLPVARFNANSNRANLNCNRNPTNTNAGLGITGATLSKDYYMKTYKNIFEKIAFIKNLHHAYLKARREKSKKFYVIEFEENLENELKELQYELISKTYEPHSLKRFIIRDPKTRTIHSSFFRDRVIHHAIVNILEPIFEKIFIYDSYASRKNKGTHLAVKRFEEFMRKVSGNGKLVKDATNNNQIQGYCLKADIKSYFDNVDHDILIKIIGEKVSDLDAIWLIRQVLNNFKSKKIGKGMPLGNFTSQFFANVYLNKLDYFVKHELKAKYYIRYVDDIVILHRSKKRLEYFKKEIDKFIVHNLKIWLHPDKSKIIALRNGVTFLGYRIFFHYKLLIKRNLKLAKRKVLMFKNKEITEQKFLEFLQGWEGYAKWASSYNLKKRLLGDLKKLK
jgi:retron-type reverse transcriptase